MEEARTWQRWVTRGPLVAAGVLFIVGIVGMASAWKAGTMSPMRQPGTEFVALPVLASPSPASSAAAGESAFSAEMPPMVAVLATPADPVPDPAPPRAVAAAGDVRAVQAAPQSTPAAPTPPSATATPVAPTSTVSATATPTVSPYGRHEAEPDTPVSNPNGTGASPNAVRPTRASAAADDGGRVVPLSPGIGMASASIEEAKPSAIAEKSGRAAGSPGITSGITSR